MESEIEAANDDVSLDADDYEALKAEARTKAEAIIAQHRIAISGEGGRSVLSKLIWRLQEAIRILGAEVLTQILVESTWNARCKPEWSAKEIRDAVESVQSRGSPSSAPRPAEPEPDADLCNAAYGALLDVLRLSRDDRASLHARGFSDDEIAQAQYRTSPTNIDLRQKAAKSAQDATGDRLSEVPGFWWDGVVSWDWTGKDSQLIPVRDIEGRVIGLRSRYMRLLKNKKGAPILDADKQQQWQKVYGWVSTTEEHPTVKRTNCVHHPIWIRDMDHSVVEITEGEYKADYSTLKLGRPVLSVPGVESWRLGLEAAKALGAKQIVISMDADADTKERVANAIVELHDAAKAEGLEVGVRTWDAALGKGLDDVVQAGHLEQVRLLEGDELEVFLGELVDRHGLKRANAIDVMAMVEDLDAAGDQASDDDWKSRLLRTKAGPKNVPYNVEEILRRHPAWKGRLVYNEFVVGLAWGKQPPWVRRYPETKSTTRGTPWTDDDDTRLISFLNTLKIDVSDKVVRTVANLVAKAEPYHPVREYLESVKWDGTPRLESWLTTYMGVEASEYATKAGTWWLLQGVRRIFEPGAMAKYILTLEGAQDLGKSTALKALMPDLDWFSESHLDVGTLAGQLGLKGVWLWELAEADILKRADRTALKAYIGQCTDRYTPKFSNKPVTVRRQVFFAMTVNPEGGGFLSDPTGNVRYWPVECHAVGEGTTVDIDGLRTDRDQLWAEAVALYRQGVIPEPRTQEDRQLFGEVVAERVQVDPWEAEISGALEGASETWVEHVLETVFDIPPKAQKRGDQLRVSTILKQLGWQQAPSKQVREGKRVRLYVRDGDPVRPAELTAADANDIDSLSARGWTQTVLPDGRRVLTQPEGIVADEELAEVIDLMMRV